MTPREGAEAAPQNEVDAVRWLGSDDAIDTLTYERDMEIMQRFARARAHR